MMTLVEAMIAETESLAIVVAPSGVPMDWYGTQMKMVNKWTASDRLKTEVRHGRNCLDSKVVAIRC